MSRYSKLFSELKVRNEGAFVPFVMLGDPDLETSRAIIETLITAGADALELGFPFSDPIADGPVIQEAANRALAAGVTPDGCFQLVAEIRRKYPDIAIGLLVYSNLVAHQEPSLFYRRAAEVGVDSVLIADIPGVELLPFAAEAKNVGIAPIVIVPPNANDGMIANAARLGEGYTYLLGRAGVTGAETAMQAPAERLVSALEAVSAPPCLLGFGISTPAHVRSAIEAGAAGAIAGSATVAIIARHLLEPEMMHDALRDFVRLMKAATLP